MTCTFLQEDVANPTRDTLAEGIIGLLRPSLETLDMAVVNTRYFMFRVLLKIG